MTVEHTTLGRPQRCIATQGGLECDRLRSSVTLQAFHAIFESLGVNFFEPSDFIGPVRDHEFAALVVADAFRLEIRVEESASGDA